MWDEFGNETLPTDNSSTTFQPPVADTEVVSVMESGTRGGSDGGWSSWSQGALDKLLGAWATIETSQAVGQTYKAQAQIDPRTGQPYVAQRYAGATVSGQGVTLNTQTLMLIGMGVMVFMLIQKD